MLFKKKKNPAVLTHVKTVEKVIDTDEEIIKIINDNIERVPLEIYEIIKNLPEEIITGSIHDQSRKAILRVLYHMAKKNDELVGKMTKRIVQMVERDKTRTIGEQIEDIVNDAKAKKEEV